MEQKGYRSILGIQKVPAATGWDTAVVVGADDGIEYLSESLTANVALIQSKAINGTVTPLKGGAGSHIAQGEITCEANYQQQDVLLALGMGTVVAPVQIGATTAYRTFYKLANELSGLFATVVIDKQTKVFEFGNVKVGGFNFSCQPGDAPATFTFPMTAHRMRTDSVVNDAAAAALITIPAVRELVLFPQMKVYVGAEDGTGLAEAYVNGFSVNVTRALNQRITTRYGIYVEEPQTNDFVIPSGNISFPAYATENDPHYQSYITKAAKTMKVVLTGGLAGVGNPFSLTFWFPNVQFSAASGPNAGGPGEVPLSVDFIANRASAVPTGFPAGQLESLWIEQVNQRLTSPLLPA